MLMRLQESHGSPTPQNPWPSPKEVDEAVGECVGGDCEKAKAIIGVARLGEYGSFMLVRAGVAALLEGQGLPQYRICQVVAVDGHRLKHLMGLNEILEFKLVSGFKPRTIFDAYWMYTSLVTLKLPFIVRSRFDPKDICGAFRDEEICHRFIAGYLIAEVAKSGMPSRRFKQVSTSYPASVATILSIADYLAMKQVMTKVYIDERQRKVHFIFSSLPEDVERFIEDVLRDPTSIAELADEEFLAFLSGLLAGDGSVVWSRGIMEVMINGNLKKEEPLYVVIQSELGMRFGIKATLYEWKNINTIELYAQYYDAMRLLYLIPPVIEPLKETRRQVLLNKGRLGAYLARELFDLLGDGKREGEKGIRKLQSRQALRFFTVLARLGLIRLKEVEGRRYHILETSTNPHGRRG